MISDFHVHTAFSGDSDTLVRDQIERAIDLGMEEICITDHHDFDVDTGSSDFILDFESYFKYLFQFKEEYAHKIRIKIGLELGLQPHLSNYCKELTSKYPFDFVIGSTHFVAGEDPYFPYYFDGRDERIAYEQYFRALLNNIQVCDDYDVVGHIDYIVRYGPNKNKFYNYDSYRELLDSILETVLNKGKGIECNTAGFRQGLGHPNPHPDILRRYRELGGEVITVGSDAHMPKDLGADFTTARAILESCGYRAYTTFENRKPIFHKL